MTRPTAFSIFLPRWARFGNIQFSHSFPCRPHSVTGISTAWLRSDVTQPNPWSAAMTGVFPTSMVLYIGLPDRRFNCPPMLFNLTGPTLRCDETHNAAWKEFGEVGIRLTHQAPIPSMGEWKTILGTVTS